MDLQHLNKIEARLQDLEQDTLSGVLKAVLQQTRPGDYSSVATQAAEAIKAAFEALQPKAESLGTLTYSVEVAPSANTIAISEDLIRIKKFLSNLDEDVLGVNSRLTTVVTILSRSHPELNGR